MPFLRRRGVMASDSDMRRHTSFFGPLSGSKLPQQPEHAHAPLSPVVAEPDAAVLSIPASHIAPGVLDVDAGFDGAIAAAVTAAADRSSAQPSTPITPTHPAHSAVVTPPFAHDDHDDSHTTRGTVSIDGSYISRPESPPIQEQTPRHRRFSLLRFRNASDSQLAARARHQAQTHAHADADAIPPIPNPPEIIMTAPTFVDPDAAAHKKQSRVKLPSLSRKSSDLPRTADHAEPVGRTSNTFGSWSRREKRRSMIVPPKSNGKPSAVAFDEAAISQQQQGNHGSNGSNGSSGSNGSNGSSRVSHDHAAAGGGPMLGLPVNRRSESSRSDESSGDRVYGTTTTTTHTVHTTTTFFRLSRRRKNSNPQSIFPISHLPQRGQSNMSAPVEGTISENGPPSNDVPYRTPSRASTGVGRDDYGGDDQDTPVQASPASQNRNAATPSALSPSPAMAFFQKGHHSPASAFFRPSSRNSGHSSPTRSNAGGGPGILGRGRSSTLSSIGRDSVGGGRESTDDHLTPPTLRSSSSATGRKSFSDLLGLSRLRQNSEPNRHGAITPVTPCSNTSKNNSLQLPRDSIILPERRDDDTPAKYLARLEEVVSRSVIASALSKSTDPFSQSVLRSYMRSFKFFGDPMDMAIRKLLMEAELPRETQQIDRFLQAFANRYHECNPGIFSSPDQAYFIAFSLLILHTDVFNKNNKYKMQKVDYQKNTRGEGIFDEILEVFYDNITYTPFIHVEDDLDINGERIIAHKARRKSIFPNAAPDLAKKSAREPIDPYTLIIDDKLDVLRPSLKDVMQLDDPYSFLGTAKSLNMKELQKTFFRTGVLQIVSARSRPDAFMTEKTATNPEEAHPGIVDIKITKVGLLWRKDTKKKKARSPWQEWGAILTGAQLYFFRNTSWVKNLIHQYEAHIRHGHDGIPIIFQPPLDAFKPDALMSTDGAVALLDSSYKKHKHAFTYVRHGGTEEVLLADNEDEMNDWLAKLNYASAFRSSGVRMRGVVGGFYEGQDRRAIRRLDTDEGLSVQTPTGEVTITRSRIDQKMAHDILVARRDIMFQKIDDANHKLEEEEKKLEVQLRNARHLQIMAPIQPKTREQMLISAARMCTQIKWTRVEMWRLRCHRDILQMDLDDERQTTPNTERILESGAAMAGIVGASAATAATGLGGASVVAGGDKQHQSPQVHLEREQSKTSTVSRVSLHSSQAAARRGSFAGVSIGSGGTATASLVMPDSPVSEDVFQTPPTSATGATFLPGGKHQSPVEPTAPGFDFASLRKTSVSSAMSSGPSITSTPPRAMKSVSSARDSLPQGIRLPSAPATAVKDGSLEQEASPHAVDVDEYQLLQKAGLLESVPAATGSSGGGGSGKGKHTEPDDATTAPADSSKPPPVQDSPQTPLQDKNKIRRSLQRTLREGAGHLSTRGRRAKDGSGGGAAEDGSEEPIILERGSGSFVVHGKKASVITFGNDFSMLSPDERLRQRKQQQQQSLSSATVASAAGLEEAGLPLVSGGDAESASSGALDTGALGDYRTAMLTDRERRESAASASTATARSFRELHRKYSSVRAASRSSTGGKALISDDESEAAVSNSEGSHTALPLTTDSAAAEKETNRRKHLSGVGEASGSEEERRGGAETSNSTDGGASDDEGTDDEDETGSQGARSGSPSAGAQAEFFTPDPPATPVAAAAALAADNSDVPATAGQALQAVHV